ncbi:acyl carrier protein [Arthrobacter sp. H5]|uniref:acyl carrier protein n=1 Tax=Arthrobacter sp. H5 TaxID=1267973 RepID=UPI0004886D76|nr:acyl carrier protein [Arthrobacter sp. H5]
MNNIETVRNFVIEEFLPGTNPAELGVEDDLLNSGVLDSLGLLKMIAWIESTFDVPIGDTDLDPDNFSSLAAIDGFITSARQGAPTV